MAVTDDQVERAAAVIREVQCCPAIGPNGCMRLEYSYECNCWAVAQAALAAAQPLAPPRGTGEG